MIRSIEAVTVTTNQAYQKSHRKLFFLETFEIVVHAVKDPEE